MAEELLYEDTLPGGRHWSFLMKRGHTLRLIDVEGGANVGMLLYNPQNPLERINVPDTLKCQHTFRLTTGNAIYSDMGRVFCCIGEDTAGWHDAASGTCNKALIKRKWGELNYQQARNDYFRNGRDSFLIELGKYGLGKKDMAANLNLFSKVTVSNDGAMTFVPGNSKAGDHVDLRFEMDTLVALHTCPHPLDTSPEYPRRPVTYQFLETDAVSIEPPCVHSCGENERGYMNNFLYQLSQ